MGRSFITLKLIDIMEDEKIHKISELQRELELSSSSVRNYVYELKYFGYAIKSYRGKYGGYRLLKKDKKDYNIHI